jgi:hypothetical protein
MARVYRRGFTGYPGRVRTRSPSSIQCARALWLLGLTPPVSERDLAAAFRARIRQAHPDRHVDSSARTNAATVLTRAITEARAVVAEWIDSGRDWPDRRGRLVLRFDEPEPWPEREPEPEPAPVCRHTGLRRGDRVRVWPYDGDAEVVTGTERDVRGGQVWVLLAGAGAARAERTQLAAYSCPVCGLCAGPVEAGVVVRPCPQCLVDLRRLEARPAEAGRVRSGIEARATAGRLEAERLEDSAMTDRAEGRRVWARRLRQASDEDLHAALLSAFGRAFQRWSESTPGARQAAG